TDSHRRARDGAGGSHQRRRSANPDGDNRKRRPRRKPPSGKASPVPDQRAMEHLMWNVPGAPGQAGGEDTPQARAQDILYRAYEEPDPRRRVELAREALAVWPDAADAYGLLAEHAAGRKEALQFYEQAVAAGERAIGAEQFREATGHFWGLLETRPYMRARAGLANALWSAGRREQAIAHLQDMLRLNPNDNQGIRYTLAGFLLAEDRDEDLARLLDQYQES